MIVFASGMPHELRGLIGVHLWSRGLAAALLRHRRELDQEHRDGMLAGMPPEMRTQWTEQMEPAFNAFMAEVRR